MNRSKFHSLFFYASSLSLIFAAVFFLQAYLSGPKVHAQVVGESEAPSTQTLYGFGWSETIGWISFNGVGTYPYDVIIDESGNMTGYGWSENIGWVKFGGLSGFPSGYGTSPSNATFDGSTFRGWIRVCAGMDNEPPTPPNQTTSNNTCFGVSRTDGWDGWISLKGVTNTLGQYGVTATQDPNNPDRKNLSGFLWGSDVVGWIDMSKAWIIGSEEVTTIDISAYAEPAGCPVEINWSTVPDPVPESTTFGVKDSKGDYLPGAERLDYTIRSFPDLNTIPGNSYSYSVGAYDDKGNLLVSADTNTVNVDPNCAGISSPPDIGSFTAVPASVPLQSQCALTWAGIKNVDVTQPGQSCVITGPGQGLEFPYSLSTTTNGSHSSTRIKATSRYTITCTNSVGTIFKLTTCSLKPAYNEF